MLMDKLQDQKNRQNGGPTTVSCSFTFDFAGIRNLS